MAEVVAETDRLRLRTSEPADRPEFVRHTNTPAVMRWLGGIGTDEDFAAAFERLDGYQRDFGHTLWIVERQSDGALLGFCGLKRINSPGGEALHGQFEIGWRFREDVWGYGYAKEAAMASLDLAFDRFGAPHVIALTVAGNTASQALMKRLGMVRREDLDFDSPDNWVASLNPVIVYRIDSADWPGARERALQPR